MKHQILPLCVLVLAISGCSTSTESVEKGELELQPKPTDNYLDFGGLSPDAELERGEWEVVDGSRICRGYLTRFENEEFCAKSVPSDWKEFTYDGQTYYMQPLSGS